MSIEVKPARATDNMKIRPLQAEIAKIHYECRPELLRAEPRYYTDVEFTRIIENPDSFVMLAEDCGEVVGYVFAYIRRNRGHSTNRDFDSFLIDDICVKSDRQREGIGSMLFGLCRERAEKLGCRNIELGVWAFNKDAIEFYRSLGMSERVLRMELLLGDPDIRSVTVSELPECLAVIRESFATVAAEFSLTEENCPTHTSFMTLEKLSKRFESALECFTYHVDDKIVGYCSLTDDGEYCELNNLAVLPAYRHGGIGEKLIEHAKKRALANGKRVITLGMINSNEVLKEWYISKGFTETGSRDFPHLPFKVCFMKCELL